MSELISGKEAKLAWANGNSVQIRPKTPSETWEDLSSKHSLDIFDQVISHEFRLKPRTIMIGDVEVPAPFEPKDGEEVYFIDCETNKGYSSDIIGCGCEDNWIQFGAWRTESEIKQVVAALRKLFKGGMRCLISKT